MKYLYVDTETTGLDRDKCAVWQVAGIVSADGQTEEFNFSMCPPSDAQILEVSHKFTDYQPPTWELLRTYPPHDTVYAQFSTLLSKYVDKYDKMDKFHMVGYNTQFDYDFLRKWFIQNGDDFFGSYFWFPPIDVMYLASIVLAGERHLLPNFRLSTLYNYLFPEEKEGLKFHDAFDDIKATKRILSVLFSRLKS